MKREKINVELKVVVGNVEDNLDLLKEVEGDVIVVEELTEDIKAALGKFELEIVELVKDEDEEVPEKIDATDEELEELEELEDEE